MFVLVVSYENALFITSIYMYLRSEVIADRVAPQSKVHIAIDVMLCSDEW